MGDDFIVESKGHCFICLERLASLQNSHVKIEGQTDLSSPQVYSLQSLSRCLKMDMSKVFNQKEPIPQHLLDQVQKSKLNAELCEECVVLNDKVTKLCRQLEKIQMELKSSLNSIHGKFIKSEETIQAGMGFANSGNSSSDWKGKLEILENLRKEATQKCFRTLSGRLPRITVKNLSKKEIARHKVKLKKASPIDIRLRQPITPSAELSDEGLAATLKLEVSSVKEGTVDSLPGDDGNYTASYPYNSDMDYDDAFVQDSTTKEDQGDEAKIGGATFTQIPQSIADESGKQERRYIFNQSTGKFKCTVCSKEFSNSSNANKHYKGVHQKIKYKCSLCKTEFSQLGHYKIHHQSVHLGVMFKCSTCNKMFKYKKNLRMHQKQTGCGENASRKLAVKS